MNPSFTRKPGSIRCLPPFATDTPRLGYLCSLARSAVTSLFILGYRNRIGSLSDLILDL